MWDSVPAGDAHCLRRLLNSTGNTISFDHQILNCAENGRHVVIIIRIKIEIAPEILKGFVTRSSRNLPVVQSKRW